MTLYKISRHDHDDRREQLLQASGIKSGGRPHGFDALVGFNFGEIYIDDLLAAGLDQGLDRELELCLKRLGRLDYGSVSADEKDENTENFYFGGGKGLTARYEISAGLIEIKVLDSRTEIRIISGR